MEISFTRVALLAAALFFVGCDQKPQPAKTHATEVTVLEGKTMGTFWRASIPGIDAKRSAELKEKIQTQLDADDQLLSTYKKDSALMRFNDSQSLTPWPVSEAMADIVTTSLRIGAKTDGAMDITVALKFSPSTLLRLMEITGNFPMYSSHSFCSCIILNPLNIVGSQLISKKHFSMLIFRDLPKRLGRVNKFTFPQFSKSSLMNIVLST